MKTVKQILLIYIIWLYTFTHSQAQIITTIAGRGSCSSNINSYCGDGGFATDAGMSGPLGLKFDVVGNLYIGDGANQVVRMVNKAGIISTVAGIGPGAINCTGDGGLAKNAGFNSPFCFCFDATGNYFIGDNTGDNVRKVNSQGTINTVAGIGCSNFGYNGDGQLAINAYLNGPQDLTIGAGGNLFIADMGNCRVRQVDASGKISTYAGNGTSSFSGDGGQATAAGFYGVNSLVFDENGNLYVGTYGRIRKIDPNGIISTIAGNGSYGYSGDGGAASAAELFMVRHMVFDKVGNLFFADSYNNCVRKIDLTGTITTIAGKDTAGFSGDGGLATAAKLNSPIGLAFDSVGNLYVADANNCCVRKISNVGNMGINPISLKIESAFTIFPNPAKNSIHLSIYGLKTNSSITIYTNMGDCIQKQNVTSPDSTIDIENLEDGVYFVQLMSGSGIQTKKIIVKH